MTTNDSPALGSSLPSPDGLSLQPFRALRYADPDPARLAQRLCPPYDVIDDAERADLEHADPYNAVHLILPRPAGTSRVEEPGSATSPGPGSEYDQAARLLRRWRESGVLAQDAAPAIYVYEIASQAETTRGLLGALALSQPEAGIVLPHENTMAGPVSDRLALTAATQSNLEPIFCVYDGTAGTATILNSVEGMSPLAEATPADGSRHRLWAITDTTQLDQLAKELHPLHALIADGHHRYATYLQHQRDRHQRGAGPGPWDFGLAFLVDARKFGPSVEAIHRVLPGLSYERATARAADGFTVTPIDGPADAALRTLEAAGAEGTAFVVTDGDRWSLLTAADSDGVRAAVPAGHSPAWSGLDVTVAHHYLIGGLWGVVDTTETVDVEHDVDAAIRKATAAHGVCLLLNATPVEQVACVAADGERMPRKSTLFLPKPRTGVVFRPFDTA